jgi:hypothetical protein
MTGDSSHPGVYSSLYRVLVPTLLGSWEKGRMYATGNPELSRKDGASDLCWIRIQLGLWIRTRGAAHRHAGGRRLGEKRPGTARTQVSTVTYTDYLYSRYWVRGKRVACLLVVTLNLVAKMGLRIWVGFGFSWVSGFGSRKARIFPRKGLFRRLQRLLPPIFLS